MISERQIESRIEALFHNLEFPERPENVYVPQRYMISIGGKRIRPRLCLTAYAALGGKRSVMTSWPPPPGIRSDRPGNRTATGTVE